MAKESNNGVWIWVAIIIAVAIIIGAIIISLGNANQSSQKSSTPTSDLCPSAYPNYNSGINRCENSNGDFSCPNGYIYDQQNGCVKVGSTAP